jgi:RNA polymerase sigma factor (sigma-70 family)
MDPIAHEYLPTRWSLLSRLKDWDDQESWRQFFDLYWRLIHNTALQSGLSHAEAQDVVQDVIISVAKKIESFRTDPSAGSFKHWLLKNTQWRIKDQLRQRARQRARQKMPSSQSEPHTATIEEVADPSAETLEKVWDQEWQRHVMDAVLVRVKNRVKPEMLQLFDLLVVKGWPALKVSRRMGVSLTQVYYARWKVGSLVRQEVRKLEKMGV